MSGENVIRGWKDEEHREGLTESERGQLPTNPVGLPELTESDMGQTEGGCMVTCVGTAAEEECVGL
jgi:mersacidin/lichenicidin family type 2 lantibiotic